MNSSSFDHEVNKPPFPFSCIEPIRSNGATSDTYKALIYGKYHFLKRPKKEFLANPIYLSAFQKEFEIGYTLDHPNIVRYISKGEDSQGGYILTDYVDGFTLTDFIKLNPNYFDEKNNIDKLIKQLLSALGYLHERQILHLDLKPDNILITSINHDVKIVDFGFSYTDCFSSFAIGRTVLYAAPEQLNKEGLDQRTDVYGFGKVLEYIFRQTCDVKGSSLFKKLVNKCLSGNKEDRFKSISEIQNQLLIKSKSKNKVVYFSLIIFGMLVIGLFIDQSISKVSQKNIALQANDTIFNLEKTTTEPTIIQNIKNRDNPNNKIFEKQKDRGVDSGKIYMRKILNNEKYYGKYYDSKESLNDTISQALFEQYIKNSKQEFAKIYVVNSSQIYSRAIRLKKMNECAEVRNRYGERMKWSPQRAAFNQIIAIEQRKIAANYYQKSLISELNEYIDRETPSIETKEDVINSIEKNIAPYWLVFYEKYSKIETEEECSDAEKIYLKAFMYSQTKENDMYSQYKSLFSSEQELYNLLNKDNLGDAGKHGNNMLYIFKAHKDMKGYKWVDYVSN